MTFIFFSDVTLFILHFLILSGKEVKCALEQIVKAQKSVEAQLYTFFNLGPRWCGWLTPRPDRFTPGKEIPFPFYRRLVRPQGRSGRVRKIRPHRDLIPGPSSS